MVYIPEFMCQPSSRDLVFQILSNFSIFFNWKVCMHKVVTYNSRAQWCENKVIGSEILVSGQKWSSKNLQHNMRKAKMMKHDCQQLTSVLLPKSLFLFPIHGLSHTHSHSETHSPNDIQNKETGDFWFQYHPLTVTPRMVHYHANHAKNNENVFI